MLTPSTETALLRIISLCGRQGVPSFFLLYSFLPSVHSCCLCACPTPLHSTKFLFKKLSSRISQSLSYLYPSATETWCPIKTSVGLQGGQRDFLGWGKLLLQLFLILMKCGYEVMYPHCLFGMIYNKDLYLADVEHLHGQTNHSF